MANLTGAQEVFHSDTSIVDSSQLAPLGSRARDINGNEYVYLQGVGSTLAGSWVVYDESYGTTLAIANEVGPVAIAMAAVNATTEYGWYQVLGKNTVALNDGAVAADKALYLTAAAGYVDDADVAGDAISGAASMAQSSGSTVTVMIAYPFVHDIAFD